jgi:hypothetical protein
MGGNIDHSRQRDPIGRGLRLCAVLGLSIALVTSCSSSDSETDDSTTTDITDPAVDDSATIETTDPAVGESVPPSIDDSPAEAPSDDQADDQADQPATGSGPDGVFLVGDTYSDGDFDFTYEGLVKVPLDSLGEYSEGECFYAIGTVTFLEGPVSQVTDRDSFRASFAPIIGGAVDTEQDDEFFNCDAGAMGDLGYTQSVTTDVAIGDTVGVWLDAIYLAPDQIGQLDGFQLYGDETLVFAAEVTEDVSG